MYNYIIKYEIKNPLIQQVGRSIVSSWVGGTVLVTANDKREAKAKARERIAKMRPESMGKKTRIVILWVKRDTAPNKDEPYEEAMKFTFDTKTINKGDRYGV